HNLLFLLYVYLYGHLQHSHLWIPFTGVPGRLLISPAHHQIHHSTNPVHFDKNFGAGLALYDWLFGTLHMPSKERERLTFGVHDDEHLKTMTASTVHPFILVWKHFVPMERFKKTEPSLDGSVATAPEPQSP